MRKLICATVAFFILATSQGAWASCGSQSEFNCMVSTINGEARGEPYEGMLVVGKALKTRKLRGYIGKSICGISKKSFAPRSFSSTRTSKSVQARVIKAAKAACAAGDSGYTHFHSLRSKTATSWAKKFSYKGKVGRHWLFNAPSGTKSSFNGVIALEDSMINDNNFITETDVYYYEASDEEVLNYYTTEDDQDTEAFLQEPYVETIEI